MLTQLWPVLVGLCLAAGSAAAKVDRRLEEAVARGGAHEAIVEFETGPIPAEMAEVRRRAGLRFDSLALTTERAQRYQAIKDRVLPALAGDDLTLLREYSHLPMAFLRVRSPAALARLAAHPEIRGVYRNEVLRTTLAESAPLIGQPAAAAANQRGNGATVLVIDTGVLYNRSEFGTCATVGQSGCRVAYFGRSNLVRCTFRGCTYTIGPVTAPFDPSGHGTNVSAIVLGVAPSARVAVIDVFENDPTTDSDRVIAAINWGIANQAAYNIVALNLSLGNTEAQSATECGAPGNPLGNPYVTPVDGARAVGILPVASAGNRASTNGISAPACTAGVVSVGAVYDAAFGGITWNGVPCTDQVTHSDRVACFSNSAPILDLLAPGALITAGGNTFGGTSQAAPVVAGAVAVLRAPQNPIQTLDATLDRLKATGVPVTDPRNGIVTQRVSLGAALDLAFAGNDAFSIRFTISGAVSGAVGTNAGASKQAGEPNHAGNGGGKSVWWRWVAPSPGQVTLDTAGSSFNTLLGVYTGSAVGALTSVAANDDGGPGGTSSVTFQAQAGVEYLIAVDGFNGASGSVALALSANATAAADLSVALAARPSTVPLQGQITYTVTVRNNGPQPATSVRVTDVLPPGLAYVSSSAGCTLEGANVTCPLGTLASGAEAVREIVAAAQQAGVIVNTVAGTSETPDTVTTNNSASATVTATSGGPGGEGGSGGAKVPLLPGWATLLAVLAICAVWATRTTPRGH